MTHEDHDIIESMFAEASVDIQPESMSYSMLSGTEEVELSHKGEKHEVFEGLAQQMADISEWYSTFNSILLVPTDVCSSRYVDL